MINEGMNGRTGMGSQSAVPEAGCTGKNLKRNPEIPDFVAGYLDKSINLMRSGGCR